MSGKREFLHNKFSFTRNLSKFNNKITVGSRSYPYSSIWTSEDLKKQKEFQDFFLSPFNRNGYKIKTIIEDSKKINSK